MRGYEHKKSRTEHQPRDKKPKQLCEFIKGASRDNKENRGKRGENRTGMPRRGCPHHLVATLHPRRLAWGPFEVRRQSKQVGIS